jgi:multidrug efflux system membrane fusion protein
MTRTQSWVGAAIVVALGAVGIWYQTQRPAKSANPVRATAIPVTAASARRQDVPVYVTGLGTVVAFNRVTVHVRVDGELQAVNFDEGQDVKQGDQLAQIDPRPFRAQLDQAQAAKARDEAHLANARLDLDRYASLVAKDFATRQSVDTQKALIAQLEATIRGDQAAIENAETQLGYTSIVAPLGGRTGMRLIDRGNMVHASDQGGLVVITQVHPIAVLFSLPQDHLQDITSAMREAHLQVHAFSRDGKTKVADGILALIDNQIDAATGTIRLKAVFPNDDDALWPGEFVHARLTVGVRRNAITVPAEAVQRGPHELYLFVAKADSTVERRRVTVGLVRDDVAVIESGVSEGERVITDGQFKLTPGAKVAVTSLPPAPRAPVDEEAKFSRTAP